jgi:hypothetical protein
LIENLHVVNSNKSQGSIGIGVQIRYGNCVDGPIHDDDFREIKSSDVGIADQDVSIDGCTSCKRSIEISLIGDQKRIDIANAVDARVAIVGYIANLRSSCSFLCELLNMRIT